ncbi:glycosyltransferase [Zobellia uliginosa]|uniref:glycosyltransferase n=1 Tax=Zobellia uliginosa TaxID=143224 RepID=UPI0026E34EB5|nr:glycosyltransferase [Zobellia uliginosa]MDO6518274.1 glycosyltransferase [Zobellia uliginosa]
MKTKIKVLFILPSLKAGGAERVVSYLAQSLNKDKFESSLLVIGSESDIAYEVKDVSLIILNKKRVLHAFVPILKIIKRSRPDIVFSSIGHLNAMMGIQSIFFSNIRFIGRETNVLSVLKNYTGKKNKKSFGGGIISKIGHHYLHKLVCQSEDMANDLVNEYNFSREKLCVINNPIPMSLQRKKEIVPVGTAGFKLITVGRLKKQKGHLRILEALAKLRFPYQYTMIGDGPEKEVIFERAKGLGVFEHLVHIEFTDKVFEYLAESHLFLQGSYVEGFPNALLESCAVGTPVLAFNAPGGIDEIIEEGVNGYIVDSIEDYSEKIEAILKTMDSWVPDVVSDSVFRKYSTAQILGRYEELFIESAQN